MLYAKCQRTNDNCIFIKMMHIIGKGNFKSELRDLAKELGIADHVEFPGYVPHEELPGNPAPVT